MQIFFKKNTNMAGEILDDSIYLNKIHHYWEIATTFTYLSRLYGRKFKVFKEKVKGSDRDVSTVVLRVFLFRDCTRNHDITLTKNMRTVESF